MYTYSNQKIKRLFWNIEDYLKDKWVYENSEYVRLANEIPWDELCEPLEKLYCKNNGRPSKNMRQMVAMEMLKNLLKLSDRKIVQQLQVNMEVKYFCGIENMNDDTNIEASSLTHFRNKLSSCKEVLEKMQNVMLKDTIRKLPKKRQWQYDQDSTVIEEKIKYPNDVDLLWKVVEEWGKIIDKLRKAWKEWFENLVSTWRRIGKKVQLGYNFAGKKKQEILKESKEKLCEIWEKTVKKSKELYEQIKDLKDKWMSQIKKELEKHIEIWWKIIEQQKEMLEKGTQKIKNRIISYVKPYIRPIMKGKQGKKVEFWAKVQIWMIWWKAAVAVSTTYENEHDWWHIKKWVEKVEEIRGKPPSEVWYDKWWRNQEAYEYLKEKEILNGIQGSKERKELPKKTQKRLYKRRAFNENIINDVKNHRWVNKSGYKKENLYLKVVFGCISSNLIRIR